MKGHYEIVSLVGTIDPDGQHHLHISISDSEGATFGGHVYSDHIIYTTGIFKNEILHKIGLNSKNVTVINILSAEIVIGTNENETYSREDCELSGWPELVVKKSV